MRTENTAAATNDETTTTTTEAETLNAKQRKAARERARRRAKKEAASVAKGGDDSFGGDFEDAKDVVPTTEEPAPAKIGSGDFETEVSAIEEASGVRWNPETTSHGAWLLEAQKAIEAKKVADAEVEPVPPTLPSQPNPPVEAAPEAAPEAEPASATTSKAKAYDYRGDAKEAAARLRSTIGKLEKWDWSRFGVDGVRGAIGILRQAMAKLETLPTRVSGIHVGSEVTLRPSTPATISKAFTDAEKAALVVVEVRGTTAVVSVGEARAFIPVRFLSTKEVAQ